MSIKHDLLGFLFFAIRTCALLSIAQMWGDGDCASLSNADSNQPLVHASDHIAPTHVGVIGTITGITVEQTALTLGIMP